MNRSLEPYQTARSCTQSNTHVCIQRDTANGARNNFFAAQSRLTLGAACIGSSRRKHTHAHNPYTPRVARKKAINAKPDFVTTSAVKYSMSFAVEQCGENSLYAYVLRTQYIQIHAMIAVMG